ncbi:MAG: hypothetical protein MI725_08555 [Pirellulales bacterium]|nr:hypothetical protein [Pirellulales bacterium]
MFKPLSEVRVPAALYYTKIEDDSHKVSQRGTLIRPAEHQDKTVTQ